MKADARTEAEVKAVLDRMAETYANKDIEGVMTLFAPDPDVVIYGTGVDEKRIGIPGIKALIERDFSQSDSLSISYNWMSILASGSVAWVAADVTFDAVAGGQEMALFGRLTTVLEKRADKWFIVHLHFSLPAAGQEEGESFPT